MAKAARQIALRKRKVRRSSATIILHPVWHIVLKLRTCINFAVPSGGVETTGYTLECNIKPKPGRRMDAPTPAAPPKQNRSKLLQNGRSRLFHCIMAVVYLTVLLTAVISFGIFATKQNEVPSLGWTGCILHSTFDGSVDTSDGQVQLGIQLGQNASTACLFSIWGEVVVACGALALFIMAIVVAILGTQG